jgi:N-acetylglucosaminyldiphosphoundecaprenol N-acetyl-beta-D-mannosaminyltransferase
MMHIHSPDFNRNVHDLLGLPFDALSLPQAVAHIADAALNGVPCCFATPNLNFLITAQKDAAFRQAVIRCDLSLADGMPIVWLAKMVGVPLPERVSGSDVFDALRNSHGETIRVFFFGGPPGVAELASQRINQEKKRLVCVGFESPGFGTVEDMSSEATIQRINQSGAQFLVVSLGAVKGHAWIEHNKARLQVPVISHLGAVVNFVAGKLERAPAWMRKAGLEWLWRIKEEPTLWRRYWGDALGLIKLLSREVPKAFLENRCNLRSKNPLYFHVESPTSNQGTCALRTTGATVGKPLALQAILQSRALEGQIVNVEIEPTQMLNSADRGSLMVATYARYPRWLAFHCNA